jgi:hypothetical protein
MACVITFNNKKYSYEEFASMLHDGELNKMISDGLVDESKLSGDMSVLSGGIKEGKTKASKAVYEYEIASQAQKPKLKAKAQSVVFDDTGFVSVDFWVDRLKGNVNYLDDVIKSILDSREELKAGKVSEDKVVKSYLITLASMGSAGGYYDNWQQKTGKSVSDIFTESVNGRKWLRPEGAAAAYLVTDEGASLIEKIKDKSATFDDVKKMFDFVGVGRETAKSEYVVKSMNNDGIKKTTDLFNQNKGSDFEQLYSGAMSNLEGIGEGKTGFFNQYFGVSGRGVVDARELNAWIAGSMKLSEEQKSLKEKAQSNKGIQSELLDRIEQVGLKLGYPKDLAGYIAHHAIWDAIADSITKHEGEYAVVSNKLTQEKEIASQADPLKGEEEERTRDERSKFEYFKKETDKLDNSKYTAEEITGIIKNGDFTVLTGENPMGEVYPDSYNESANEKAEAFLKERGYEYFPVVGKYGQTEHSFFVPGMSKKDAMDFAVEFNQDSVLTPDGLIYQSLKTNDRDKNKDRFNVDVSDPETDYATAIRLNDGSLFGFMVGVNFEQEGVAGEEYQKAKAEREIASQAPKMRRTIQNEDVSEGEERQKLITNPESFQDPAVIADERKKAENMSDDEINALVDSAKDMNINDENPKVMFAIIEAIKRATKSADRKFMGKGIEDLLPEAAKLASFAGKVLRFVQDLKTNTPETLSATVTGMIEKYGDIRLSPEQKAEVEQVAAEFISTKAAYEQAVKEFNKNPDTLNEKIKDQAYKMHEAANLKIKGLISRYTPPSIYKRIIANAQGNLLVAASHGVNAVSNLSRAVTQEVPKAIVKTAFDLAQNLYYFLSNNKNLMFKLGIISGSNGLVKAINPTLYQAKNNLLFGSQAQVDAEIKDAGTSVHLKTLYDWLTNPNSRVRMAGSKQFVAIGNKIYKQGKMEKGSLVSTEETELKADMMAAALNQEGGNYQAFGNEVWKMEPSKHGDFVAEIPYPPAVTEDQKTAIDLQAEKQAYEMSTVPAVGMMAKSAILQLSGITAELTQRLTSTMDIMFNNPQATAILASESARLNIKPEQLLEYAATNPEFKKYLDNRLKETTFQEDSAISGSIAKFEKKIRNYLDKPKDSVFDKTASSAAKIAYVAAKLSALFVKTPLNIGTQLVDICTFGSISFSKGIASGVKIANSTGSNKVMNQIKFRDYMAAGVASMGLALAATAIVAAGCATGDYDSYDKKQLDALQAARTPLSSINLSAVQRMLNGESTEWVEGDRVVPAKYFGLLGMTIMYFASKDNKADKSKMAAASSGTKSRVETKEGYLDFALDIPRIVMSQSAVSSANTMLKAISDKESRSWPGVAKQYAQGVVAGLGMPGTASKAIEGPITPELIDMSSSAKTAKNTAKYRLLGRFYERMTGYESGIPLKVDALGRYITSVPEGEDVTMYNLNPFQSSSYKKDPVASKFLELYEQTKDPKVVPSKLRQGVLHRVSTWDPTIEEFTLIGEDIEALNAKRGAMVYESLKSLFTSGYNVYDENIEDYRLAPYESLTLEQKRNAVSNTIAQAYRRFNPQLDQYLEALAERTGTPVSEIKKSKLLIDGYEEPEPLSDF